jgi:aminoglycoside phosphotransferase (APT) family kinase protein
VNRGSGDADAVRTEVFREGALMTEPAGEPRDLDGAVLDGWVAAQLDAPVEGLRRALLSGGMSQQTVRYDTADGRTVIVRVPPVHGPLEPYDPEAEAGVLSALGALDIPVPEVAFVEPTGDVIGRPFFGTLLVEGGAVLDGARDKGPEAKLSMGRVYADLLGRIHLSTADGGESSAVGRAIGGMPRKTPAEILRRWVDALDGVPVPAFHEFILRWLQQRMPQDGPVDQLVHGDYRLGNLLWSDDETASAVLDWEEAGLGDGYFDLGWALHATPGDEDAEVMGLTTRREFLEDYAAAVGAPVDTERLLWWEVLAAWCRMSMDGSVVGMTGDGLYSDIRAMLASYRNRKLGAAALAKIIRYETALRA